MHPKHRAELIVQEIGEETLLYCPRSQRAYCLNPVTGQVFALLDGTRDESTLATELDVDPALVRNVLALLQEHGLLETGGPVFRREILKGAAALLPALLVVAAPEPAMAASVAGGCITNIQCGQISGSVNQCQPCDTSNSSPANCSDPNSFCMSSFRVRTDPITGDASLSDTCADDSPAFGFPNQCDFVNPNNIWALDCNAARTAVINQGKPYAVYRCCRCI